MAQAIAGDLMMGRKEKYMKKVFLILLFLILVCSFAACGKKTAETTTAPVVVPDLQIIANGITQYAIVRGDKASDSVISAASKLYTTFYETCGVEIALYDEYMFSMAPEEKIIVVGTIEDEVCKSLYESLLSYDYVIHAEKGNLYILGGSDSATAEAVDYFIDNYLKEGASDLSIKGNLHLVANFEYELPALSIAGTPIKNYVIVYDSALAYSKIRAQDIRNYINEKSGRNLKIAADTATQESEYEILVGVTNREESRRAAAAFAAPNVFYRLGISGTKLLFTNDGVRTGETALRDFERLSILLPRNCTLTTPT